MSDEKSTLTIGKLREILNKTTREEQNIPIIIGSKNITNPDETGTNLEFAMVTKDGRSYFLLGEIPNDTPYLGDYEIKQRQSKS